ncbi:hypothetical protein N9R81_05430 [Flavobacteriales bacterium]|nr:hypothetical protein [Flavobacteriales bacterium]
MDHELDVFQQARNSLTKKVSYTITVCLILFSIYSFFAARQFFPVISISFAFALGISLLIYVKKKYDLAAMLFAVIALIVNSYQICFVNDVLHIVDVVWFIVFVLYSYFVLGNKWGLFSLAIFMLSLTYFLIFSWKEYTLELISFDSQKTIFLIINAILAGIVFNYLVSYYLKNLYSISIELKEKNRLNEILLKEIHHRVKNNFQVISSLIKLQFSEEEEHRTKIDETLNRISVMAYTHTRLYQNKIESIDLKNATQDIVSKTIDSFGVDAELMLESNFESQNIDTSIPILLILNELTTNSLKYAFKKTDYPKISVRFDSTSHTITYADNGQWIDNKAGFGTELLSLLSSQIDATINRTSTENGTEYKLVIQKN